VSKLYKNAALRAFIFISNRHWQKRKRDYCMIPGKGRSKLYENAALRAFIFYFQSV